MANDSTAIEAGITRELARARAQQVSDLRYRLSITLEPGAARMRGQEEIRFDLKKAGEQVVLDFRDLDPNLRIVDGTIREVRVNGAAIPHPVQLHGHILFPASLFKSGENVITLAFESAIAPAGRPITRFLDRDDGNEYVYTLFVPMDASLAFPCFDQPDLKARFTLELTTPNFWRTVSNERVMAEKPSHREGFQTTSFKETAPISTYLVAFAAGPFQLIETASPLPLRIYLRKSKATEGNLHAREILDLTAKGLDQLSRFFDHPFPFSKYDQVLIPGFAYGGMEHAGATFLREDAIIFRTTPTTGDKLNRASLVLHELSHQWFGDLVTMKWFDDLWLKEGFANYMASHAMAAMTTAFPPKEISIWKRFYQVHKPLAYAIDSTQGTTPIFQEVRNLADAKSAYGAIVYQKAPSLLRALSFKIGETSFQEGVRLFLRQHAYGNAEWADLVSAFEKASGEPLDEWAAAWIKQRGMPQVDLELTCSKDGTIERLSLRQRDVLGGGAQWPIKTRLLLSYDSAPAARLDVEFRGDRMDVPEAKGLACPSYVFANDEDYGYGRFLLDKRSRDAVVALLPHKTSDIFLRSLLWGSLWDSVREAQMPPREYLSLASEVLPKERDEELIQSLLARVTTTFQRYLSGEERARLAPRLEELCLDRMQRAGDLGVRISFFRAFRSLASTEAGKNRLKDLLAGRLTVPGMEFKPLDRWQTIRALLGTGDVDGEKLLAEERRHDTSDEGRKQAYLTEAARRDPATKRRYFSDYTQNRNVPEDWVEGSLAAFNFWSQSEITIPFLKPALEALPQIKRERKIFFGLAWLNGFIGGQRSAEALSTVQSFLKESSLDPDLRLKVLEVVDELERTVRIRSQ